jgi:predicted acetyltransferase
MATADQITEVRVYISEDDDSEEWPDDTVAEFIDRQSGGTLAAASKIWSAKAGKYAAMVNVAESGSSRSLGTLIDNALKMAADYRKQAADAKAAAVVTPTGPVIHQLSRG